MPDSRSKRRAAGKAAAAQGAPAASAPPVRRYDGEHGGPRRLIRQPELRGFVLGLLIMAVLSAVLAVTAPRSNRARRPADPPDPEADSLLAELAVDPESVDVRLGLAKLYLRRKNLRDARIHTQEALRRAPENPQALTYHGLILLASDQPEAALVPLQAAIARNPDLVETYLQLTYAYVRLDRMAEAEATIAAASKRFPDRAASMNRLLGKLVEQAAQDRGENAAKMVH